MENLIVLVVDDEKPARKKIISIITETEPNWQINEADNGIDAIDKIKNLNPDIVFLDIQMPGLNGIEVIQEIGIKKMPVTIFVTAYDQYAIKAFEVQAIDYLLKPFDKPRFLKALSQAKERIGKSTENVDELAKLLSSFNKKSEFKKRFLIKDANKHFFVNAEEIKMIEVKEKYLDIHAGGKIYLLKETITSIEKQLNPETFKRVNRSTIINLNEISEIQPWSHGDYIIILKNKNKIKLSRKYSQNIFSEE